MNKVKLKYLFIGIFLALLSCIILNKVLNPLSEPKPELTKTDSNNQDFPDLDLPLKYFSRNDLHWSLGGSDTNDDITFGSFGGESEYRSYPTTEIKVKDYDNKSHLYEKNKHDDGVGISMIQEGDEYWEGLMKDSQTKYGNFVKMYWPDYLVTGKDDFDVDLDNNKETILTLSVPELNHAPHRIDIVKNGKIIFSYSGYQPEIEPSKTNNGFYLLWTSGEQLNSGYCCPSGQMRTRFVYDNHEFNPIWEQEIVYAKIGKQK